MGSNLTLVAGLVSCVTPDLHIIYVVSGGLAMRTTLSRDYCYDRMSTHSTDGYLLMGEVMAIFECHDVRLGFAGAILFSNSECLGLFE